MRYATAGEGDYGQTETAIRSLLAEAGAHRVEILVAHLAGALAKPVWVLLPFIPDWRWLLDRDDSPWYPSARLFRQRETREWGSVMMRVREALLEFTGNAR